MNQLATHPAARFSGTYTPPGDKSISHRLVMLGALAEGESRFTNFLQAEDCRRTIEAFRKMGVCFEPSKDKLTVKGIGLNGLSKPAGELDLGNSGTTMRLLLGILAGQSFEVRLSGDASLCRRPMRRVTAPLRKMGARITGREDANFAPLVVRGGGLSGIEWVNEMASAQVKSAILLAGLFADGKTSVSETIPSRDHTERLFRAFGVSVRQAEGLTVVEKAKQLHATQFQVPGDFSSAAFLMVAALLIPNSELEIRNVGLNPTRIGLYHVLKSMGADIRMELADEHIEPVGHVYVKSSRLKGIQIDQTMIPSLIDELPILMIACALAEGVSTIRGAQELRIKETDRIHSMALGLREIGAKAEEREDGCVIEGIQQFKGGMVNSFGDHRTAMSFLVAGLCSKTGVTVQDADCIQTSYPDFSSDLEKLVQG